MSSGVSAENCNSSLPDTGIEIPPDTDAAISCGDIDLSAQNSVIRSAKDVTSFPVLGLYGS